MQLCENDCVHQCDNQPRKMRKHITVQIEISQLMSFDENILYTESSILPQKFTCNGEFNATYQRWYVPTTNTGFTALLII